MRFSPYLPFLFALACAPTPARDAALHDDLAGLKKAIKSAQERGELGDSEVKDLAQAVIQRELSSSTGDASVARVREVRSCVDPLEDALSDLSERRDPGGGAATLALLEAGHLDSDDMVSLHKNDADPVWRAVAARAAVGEEHAVLRRRWMADPDLRVRRAALRAAVLEPMKEDRSVLAEAARLDPDPMVRSLAVQTLGAIGGEDVVNGLRDLWDVSDLHTRQVIVDAWARDASYETGGEARLLATLEREQGIAALVAARGLVMQRSEHRAMAEARLLRAADVGAADERRLALSWVALDDTGTAALVEASKSEDESVAVVAAARLASTGKHGKQAREALRNLSRSSNVNARRQAQSALAGVGDRSIVKALQAQLVSSSSDERRHAALALLLLGEVSRAATGLGDDVAAVRTQVACAVLAKL